jgi:hypothetical protein
VVQRDALDSMGTLFADVGGDSQRQLSSKLSSNGSGQPAERWLMELRGLEPLTPTLPGAGRPSDQARSA